jgi:hypothetical protein
MKPFTPVALTLVFAFLALTGEAQQKSKQKMFGEFPENISIKTETLAAFFDMKTGETAGVDFTDDFFFSGEVLDNVQRYANLQSVVIRADFFRNTLLSFSKQLNEDKSVTYVGRIMTDDMVDGYRLSQDEKGNYRLVKFDASNMRQDCGYIR